MLRDSILSRRPSILLKEVIWGWGKGFSGVSLDYASMGHKSFVFGDLLGRIRLSVFIDLEQVSKWNRRQR